MQALLNALIKAEEMAAKVELPDLVYRELIVDVGPAPTVRVCWRPLSVEAETVIASPVAVPPVAPPPVLSAQSEIFGKGSFFEPRQASGAPADAGPSAPSIVASPASTPTASPVVAPVLGAQGKGSGDWKRGALDRFKRMPDLSKRGH